MCVECKRDSDARTGTKAIEQRPEGTEEIAAVELACGITRTEGGPFSRGRDDFDFRGLH